MKNFFSSLQLKKGDFIIFFVILAVIFASSALFYQKPAEAKLVKIYVGSEEYGIYQLSQQYTKNINVPVNGDIKNGYNHIQIKDGAVSIVDSTCPNRDCVRMGTITDAGDVLICLPYQLTVRLEGGEVVDAVSY